MSDKPAPAPSVAAQSRKQKAYDRYRAAQTEGTRISLPNASVLHDDFVKYIESARSVDPFDLDVSHLDDDVSFAKEAFYRTALAESFHAHYAQYDPKPSGPGNTQIVELRRDADSGQHVFLMHGLTQQSEEIRLENAAFNLTSSSVSFEEGIVKVVLKLTPHEVNGVRVWNFQLSVLDRLRYNIYLVPFRLV